MTRLNATIHNKTGLNQFGGFHPLVTFLFYVGSISLFILLFHPIFLVVAMGVILMIHFFYDRLSGIRQWFRFMIITGLSLFLLNPLFNTRGRYLLFVIGNHRITVESVVYGGINALSIIGILAIFVSYNEVMTPNKLLFLFSKLLPQFSILLMLTLRFIPLMRRRLQEISAVQKSKGVSISNGTFKNRVKAGMLYVQVLVTYSLEEAIQTADSIKARGYGNGKRSSYEHFTFKRQDVFAILYMVSLFSILLYGRMRGHGYLQIYPILGTWHLSSMDLSMLAFLILFLCFPILVEIGGMVRWRLSN